jgi:hypothetical protein
VRGVGDNAAEVLSAFPRLLDIHLTECPLTQCQRTVAALRELKYLKRLRLHIQKPQTRSGVYSIIRLDMPALERLALSVPEMSSDFRVELAAMPALHRLELRGECCVAVTESWGPAALREVVLWSRALGASRLIAGAINLRTLNGIYVDGHDCVAAIASCTALTHIKIAYIAPSASDVLWARLPWTTTHVQLESGCDIRTIQSLPSALGVRSLGLDGVYMNGIDTQFASDGSRSHGYMSDDIIRAVQPVVARMPGLESLYRMRPSPSPPTPLQPVSRAAFLAPLPAS